LDWKQVRKRMRRRRPVGRGGRAGRLGEEGEVGGEVRRWKGLEEEEEELGVW
jgi:hypothetical protein